MLKSWDSEVDVLIATIIMINEAGPALGHLETYNNEIQTLGLRGV